MINDLAELLNLSKENDTILKNIKFLNSPVFINHASDLTGAPNFLYEFVLHLNSLNIFKNIIVAEPFYNEQCPINSKIPIIYYKNNILLLLKSLIDINPVFIYSNSQNQFLFNNSFYKECFDLKTLFHFHECMHDFCSMQNQNLKLEIKKEKVFVVSESIKEQFKNEGYKNLSVFPPFLSSDKINKITKFSKKIVKVNNNFRNLDESKIVIGMSGSVCKRKNFLLFYNLAFKNPDKEFIWIGGTDWEQKEYIYNKPFKDLENLFHIPHTTNPWAYYKLLDYFFLTSDRDPCPYVVLENLLLNNKIITLKNNIYFNHNQKDLENYIVINNDNLSNNDIVNEFKKLNLNKNKNITDKNTSYILNNFSSPQILKKSDINQKNYLILSYYYNKSCVDNDRRINYFTNLINLFNILNGLNYEVIVCINSDFINQKLINSFKNIINIGKIINRPNKGYDIGGLIEGLKYVNDNKPIDEKSKLAYLHNKSNFLWAEELNKIFYQNNLNDYDTVVSDNFFVPYVGKNDNNKQIMIDNPEIFSQLYFSNFSYVQGTTFITNFKNLKPLIEKYDIIQKQLTDINKKDNYWINLMSNDGLFNTYFDNYKYNVFNDPIDKKSQLLIKKGKAFNYIELKKKFNLKGIPDGCFEHALERYIGYLISNDQKILKVE